VANVAAKYQLWNYMWPEFELNVTWWPDSLRQGSTQLFLTPGVIFRSVSLMDWLKFAVGRAISSP
jgi:hypothetical protein